jgi:serine/threonine protein kinase
MGIEENAAERVIAERYRLLALLGQGGMGRVWQANDELLQRVVAVKEVLFPAGITDADAATLRERTLREAVHAARLNSPATIRVYDVVEAEATPWIVMELVEGPSLSTVLKERGPLPPAQAARVGLGLVDALAEAHRAGVVHRDVKPGNVLFRGDGSVVLSDFGIARLVHDATTTSTGLVLGSPSYIAPERLQGSAPAPESDLWSLGATLYAAVEGHPPYDRDGPLATLAAVATEPPAAMRRAGPLAPLVTALLARDPAARPGTDEIRRELARVSDRAARAAPEPTLALPTQPLERADRTVAVLASPRSADGRPGGRRRRTVASLAALLALAVAAASGWALLHPGRSGTEPRASRATPTVTRSAPATAAAPATRAPVTTEPVAPAATRSPAESRSVAPAPTKGKKDHGKTKKKPKKKKRGDGRHGP